MKTLEVDEFKYVREEFPIQHKFELIKRNGVYPYDYKDSFARFDESRLPSQDSFFSKLSDTPCSDTEYGHATQMWTAFECESMADYHDIYLKCDVLLLGYFFERFRAICLAHYSLDAVHYYTASGLAWEAALRMTHDSLGLITDIDMYHFIEKSIRGGISMITTRYARANAPTLLAYNARCPRVNLIYLDGNNLYGGAMSQLLTTCRCRFLQSDEIEALGMGELSNDAEDGYIFEVDLSYPQLAAHDDYLLAPESLEIDRDMYSPTQQAVSPQTAPQRKLNPNLRDKVRYLVHYPNLTLYLQLGVVVTRIHRVLPFKQSKWLNTYIDLNTHQRSLARNSFLKDVFGRHKRI